MPNFLFCWHCPVLSTPTCIITGSIRMPQIRCVALSFLHHALMGYILHVLSACTAPYMCESPYTSAIREPFLGITIPKTCFLSRPRQRSRQVYSALDFISMMSATEIKTVCLTLKLLAQMHTSQIQGHQKPHRHLGKHTQHKGH